MPTCLKSWFVEVDMRWFANLLPGTAVIARVDFDPIVRGQCGVVTRCIPGCWRPWRRTVYDCIFLGGINTTVTRDRIKRREHGYNREMLADPLWFLHTRELPTAACKVRTPGRSDAADAA